MRQLDLFAVHPTPVASPPAPVVEAALVPAPPPDVLPGQVGLFEDRTLRLGRARAAIAAGQLDEACRELERVRASSPEDAATQREADRAEDLRKRLAKIDGPRARARDKALLAVARGLANEPEPWSSLRRALLGRVAEEIRRAHGEDGTLEGQPPGFYLLEAGALAEARASLTASLASRRSARALFLLADVTEALGERRAARRLYLEALLVDPFDAARATVRDGEVRLLPDVARDDLEIEDEPVAWAAAAGLLTGVLQYPTRLEGGLPPLPEEADGALLPAQREALARARAFVAAFVLGRANHPIEGRREMKRLAPRLFAFYMAGLEAGGGRR